MITWNNLDTLESFKELSNVKKVNLVEAMTGENGAERVKKYSVPMAAGLAYNLKSERVSYSRKARMYLYLQQDLRNFSCLSICISTIYFAILVPSF